MDQIIRAIAQKLGLPEPVVTQGVSILLGFLQKSNGAAYEKLVALVPGAASAVQGVGAGAQQGGGLLGNLISAAGDLIGGQGGDLVKVVGDLQNAGIGAGQTADFARSFIEEAKKFAGGDVAQHLLAANPALAELLGEKKA